MTKKRTKTTPKNELTQEIKPKFAEDHAPPGGFARPVAPIQTESMRQSVIISISMFEASTEVTIQKSPMIRTEYR